ncbi:MAG TPA: undecaprenyl-diphosphate phosphatase [Ruminococcaceae bacterium]|nr:undecaprenyl-diphosphate phosphatase [Oscillospiraceae bacterium]
MSIWEAIIQGIVQGLSEFLPISSSGHLSLLQYLFGINGEAAASFSVLLHFGTLVAVFAAFYKTIWKLIVAFFGLIGDIFRGKFSWKNAEPEKRMVLLLIISCLPLLAFYFLSDFYNSLSADNDIVVEGCCFLLTSLLLFVSDRCVKGTKTAKDMTVRDALTVGVVQGIAPLPGLSRSGSTISAGLLCGLTREYAVSFSFIMGIPPVLAANLLEVKDLVKDGVGSAMAEIGVLSAVLGIVVAAVVGFLSIKMVRWLVKKDKFTVFAWYTLILGTFTVVVGIIDHLVGHHVIGL